MMTSAYTEKQTMKTSKPAMEKRRRARINESLQQLKALVLDGLNKNNSRHSKLEKADILEMTVRYLRNVQRQQVKASMETDPTVVAQYRTGFAECMGEVSRYLGGTTNENPEVKARLLGHLAGLCTTQQRHPLQQPARYAVVAHGQTPGTNHLQSPPTPAQSSSSAGNFVTLNSAPTTTPASSVHQPMQVSFPTPPLSSGCHVAHPATLMTSPPVRETTRTGGDARVFASQAPAVETQPLSLTSEGINGVPATPKTEARASTTRQPAPMTPSLPVRTAPSTSQQTGEVITLILPSQSLPGGQVPTHLIPVYAREAGTVLSPPLGFSFATPDPAAASSTPVSSGESCNQPTACDVPTSSPKAATTAPFVIGTGQQAGWTAIPVPAAQLISPQVGAIAPSAVTPPFALSIPLHAKISPPGLAIQTKPAAEQVGRPIQLSGLNAELPGDNDPMWRPW